jgi:DNA polymerase-3 subunit alpha
MEKIIDIIPLFTSKDSPGESVLTLSMPGKSKEDGTKSVLDLALSVGLGTVFLVETSMTGFMSAYNNVIKSNLKLCYGIKLKLCRDVNEKNDVSRETESNIIIFLKKSESYSNFIKIWNCAAVDHFYYYPRIDMETIKRYWNDSEMLLAFPFYSSFLAKNFLTLSECIVDYNFTKPIFFIEDSGLPFDEILRKRVTDFTKSNGARLVKSRSIYHEKYSDFLSFTIMKCIKNRSSLDKPDLNHFSSNRFCFEDFLNQIEYDNIKR